MTAEEQKVHDLESALEKERLDFTAKITDLLPMIRNMNTIAESQVLMLSYRHMLVDKLTKYRSAIYKKKANDVNYKKSRYEYYKTGHDVRLDWKEVNEYINADMSLRIRQTDMLDGQISWCTQCIDTLDKMGFAIKNRISTEEMNYKNNT